MVRRRRPLLRGAVVVGGAHAAGKHAAGKDAPPPKAADPAAGLSQAEIDRLKELADLKDQGILTEEEFEAQKAKILQVS